MPTVGRIRWAKFRVLVVIVVASTILTILFYLFTGGTLFQAKATLYLYIPDASGIGPGSPVRVDGIQVGKVSHVELSGSNRPNRIVRVTMRVEREHLINIPVDSTADVGAETLLGDRFVGIVSGRSAQAIASGGTVAMKPETTTIDLKQFGEGLRSIDATLRDIQNGTSPLGQFVLGDQMYQDLLRRVSQIQAGLVSIESATSQIGGLLYTDQALRQFEEPMVALDQTLARIQSGQGPMGELLRDSAGYDSIRDAFAGLRKTVDDFRSSPLVGSDDQYREWNRSLASIIQQVDEMNASPLFSSSAAYDNLNGFFSEMQNAVKEFRQDPRKFLRLKLP